MVVASEVDDEGKIALVDGLSGSTDDDIADLIFLIVPDIARCDFRIEVQLFDFLEFHSVQLLYYPLYPVQNRDPSLHDLLSSYPLYQVKDLLPLL